MSAFPKGDCEDDYIVRAIDKAASSFHIRSTRSQTSIELPLCFDPKFLRIFGVSVLIHTLYRSQDSWYQLKQKRPFCINTHARTCF